MSRTIRNSSTDPHKRNVVKRASNGANPRRNKRVEVEPQTLRNNGQFDDLDYPEYLSQRELRDAVNREVC